MNLGLTYTINDLGELYREVEKTEMWARTVYLQDTELVSYKIKSR